LLPSVAVKLSPMAAANQKYGVLNGIESIKRNGAEAAMEDKIVQRTRVKAK